MRADPIRDRGTTRVAVAACAIVAMIGIAVIAAGLAVPGAILVLIAACLLSMISPEAGLVAVLVLFPVHPLAMKVVQVDLGAPESALIVLSAWKEVAVLAALLRLGPDAIQRWRRVGLATGVRKALGPGILPLILAVMVGIACVLVFTGVIEGSRSLALNQARLLLFPVGLYIGLLLATPGWTRLLWWFVASCTVVAAFGIYQSTFLGWTFVSRYFGTADMPIPFTFVAAAVNGPRAGGTLASPNEFAFVVGAAILVALALLPMLRGRRLAAAVVAIVIMTVGLGMSFSRSTIAGVALGSLAVAAIVLARAPQRRQLFLAMVVAASTSLLITAGVYAARGGFELIQQTGTTLQGEATPEQSPPSPSSQIGPTITPPAFDPSMLGHASSLRDSISILLANPAGIGLGNVGARSVPGSAEKPSLIVESWYLSMGLILGWPGLLWAIAFTAALLLVGARRVSDPQRRDALPAAIGMTALVAIVGIVLPTMLEPQAADVPWALLALGVAATGAARTQRGLSNDDVEAANRGPAPARATGRSADSGRLLHLRYRLAPISSRSA